MSELAPVHPVIGSKAIRSWAASLSSEASPLALPILPLIREPEFRNRPLNMRSKLRIIHLMHQHEKGSCPS